MVIRGTECLGNHPKSWRNHPMSSYINEHLAGELAKELAPAIGNRLDEAEDKGYRDGIRDVVALLVAVSDRSSESCVHQKYISELTPELVRYFVREGKC